jgi:hypothetical protein
MGILILWKKSCRRPFLAQADRQDFLPGKYPTQKHRQIIDYSVLAVLPTKPARSASSTTCRLATPVRVASGKYLSGSHPETAEENEKSKDIFRWQERSEPGPSGVLLRIEGQS